MADRRKGPGEPRQATRRRYRALLRLLPRTFRERWGTDMEELFLLRLDQAGGGGGRAWVWTRAVADVAWAALRERMPSWPPGGEEGMGTAAQDLRYGIRSLRDAPVVALASVATLALGIAAATATFSVVHGVLLEDLPYQDPERLVMVWPEGNANAAMVALAEEEMASLEAVSGMAGWTLTLVGTGEPVEIAGTLVSPGHFRLLGVAPALGRDFLAEEGLPGRGDVVVLSHDLWVRAFGADPEVLGRTVDLSGADHDQRTVVGVMPRGFRPVVNDTDVWIPLVADPGEGLEGDDSWYVNHRVARLAPGATLEQARRELLAHATGVQARLPGIFEEEDARTATIRPLREHVAGDAAAALWAALGAAGLVLLIACANVTNLLLARSEARLPDLAVRSALGAGRTRVARMLLAESAVLGLAGGAFGVAAAYVLVGWTVRLAPEDFPRIAEVSVSGPVLAWAVGATMVATLLAGVVPALRASRVDATACLGGGARGAAGRSRSGLSTALVGAQVALAVVVVVGSGLMLRSLAELLAVDPGLDGERVVTFRPNPPGIRYPDGPAFGRFYDQVLERVAALPAVESVGAIHLLPGTDGSWAFPTYPEGVEVAAGTPVPTVSFRAVRPGYFRTLRIPLLGGRLLDAGDGPDAEPVALVNQAFVERFWPGEEALGRTLRFFSPDGTAYRVVGVVGDVRQHGRAQAPVAEMYYAHAQVPWDQMSLWIMARVRSGGAAEHADALRAAVWSVDPEVPVAGMDDMSAVLGRSTRGTRFLALLLTAFGGVALALGALGVFGVTAYTLGRRTPEFGVRVALGASRGEVLRSALLHGFRPVGVGLVVGLVVAVGASGTLESVVYGVPTTDPLTFAAVTLTLAGAAGVAMLLPAWRASRVDPVRVLNGE